MKRVYIIPGYGATPRDHWFQSTAMALQQKGLSTHTIAFPSPQSPSLSAWTKHLRENLKEIDRDTIIVAHSLGCITTVRFLASLNPAPHIKGLVLVSPFAEKLPNLPQLDEFAHDPIDITKLKSYADACKIIVSDNDSIVPPEATHRFAAAAGMVAQEIKSGGHFLAEDGYTSFPVLVDTILTLK